MSFAGLDLCNKNASSDWIEWSTIHNRNRTEWSPIRSVIVRVINKIGRPRFVNHEYDYRQNWTTQSPVTN